jgi:hypothetical protein
MTWRLCPPSLLPSGSISFPCSLFFVPCGVNTVTPEHTMTLPSHSNLFFPCGILRWPERDIKFQAMNDLTTWLDFRSWNLYPGGFDDSQQLLVMGSAKLSSLSSVVSLREPLV